MKVLQCGKFYPPHLGGIETVTQNITEWLNGAGIRCDVLCTNDKNESIQEDRQKYTIYRSASLGLVSSVALSFPYLKKLKSLQSSYDILHIHLPNPLANLAMMFVHPDVKVVLHWHSDIIRQKKLLKLYEPLQKWLLKRADAILATSPPYAEASPYLLQHKEKVTSIPLAIDPNTLIVDPQKVQQIRKTFEGRKIIFSLGRLIYYKGFEYLIEASKYLDDSYVVLVGGEGELEHTLKRQIKKAKLENKVFLLGRIPHSDLGSYYEACDLYCMSSTEKSEAFGIAQIEAMSRGKPIVATKIPGSGVDWVNQHGETGLNVLPADAEALAGAIQQILKNRKLYERFQSNGLKRFQECFSKDPFTSRLMQLYAQLMP